MYHMIFEKKRIILKTEQGVLTRHSAALNRVFFYLKIITKNMKIFS